MGALTSANRMAAKWIGAIAATVLLAALSGAALAGDGVPVVATAAEAKALQAKVSGGAAKGAPVWAADLGQVEPGMFMDVPTQQPLKPGRYRLHALAASEPHDHVLVDGVELKLVGPGGAWAQFERTKSFGEAGKFSPVHLTFEMTEAKPAQLRAHWVIGDSMLDMANGTRKKREARKIYLAQRKAAVDRLGLEKQALDKGQAMLGGADDPLLGGDLTLEEPGSGSRGAMEPVTRAADLPKYRLMLKGLVVEELSPVTVASVSPSPQIAEAGESVAVSVRLENASDAPAQVQLKLVATHEAEGLGNRQLVDELVTVPADGLTWQLAEPMVISQANDLMKLKATVLAEGEQPHTAENVVVVPPAKRVLPTEPKKIFAHYMGCWPAATGPLFWTRTNALPGQFMHESNKDDIKRGGHTRNFDLAPPKLKLSALESAELEIRRAMRIGIDGFAVDAWAGGDDARKTLDALFEAAEKNDFPFELTICVDPVTGGNIHGSVKELLEKHGDSPKLARRHGRPLFFGYQSVWSTMGYLGASLPAGMDRDQARATPLGWHLQGRAFEHARKMHGQDIYFQFGLSWFFLNSPGDNKQLPEAAGVLARYVDALGGFNHVPGGEDVAKAVKASGAEWSGHIGMYQKENIPFEVYTPMGLDWMHGKWAALRAQDASLPQLITWNDYGENTAVAPAWQTRYAIFDLTGFYIEWWKTGRQPRPSHDKVYLVYAAYPRGAKTFPFGEGVRRHRKLEVVTILTELATVRLPGRDETYEAPAGFHRELFPLKAGTVAAELVRDGQVVLTLESPEPISDKPFRESNGFIGYSTEFDRHWRADFGDEPPFYAGLYADADGDGLPNWFEMYWFSKERDFEPVPDPDNFLQETGEVKHSRWLDFDTATFAKPDADPNRDGLTNLEAYQQQKDPTRRVAPKKGGALIGP